MFQRILSSLSERLTSITVTTAAAAATTATAAVWFTSSFEPQLADSCLAHQYNNTNDTKENEKNMRFATSSNATIHCDDANASPRRRNRILLLPDLDGTLVDHKNPFSDKEIDAFNEYWNKNERPRGSILVYNTARCIKMYAKLVEKNPNLIPPDVLITGEGTEIRWLVRDTTLRDNYGHSGVRFVVDSEWSEKIHREWWKSGLREQVLSVMNPLDCGKIEHLNDLDNAPPRGEARNAITVDRMLPNEVEELGNKLAKSIGIDRVKFFHVKGWIEGTELLTALPSFAGKDGAAKYVAKKLHFSNHDVLAAGDTKGDASMVKNTKFAFVCVGNGSDGLKDVFHRRMVKVEGDYMSQFSGAGGVIDGMLEFVENHT